MTTHLNVKREHHIHFQTPFLFFTLFVLFSGVSFWFLNHGYLDEVGLKWASDAILLRSGVDTTGMLFAVVHPPLPVYLTTLLQSIPGISPIIAPMFLTNIVMSALGVFLYQKLNKIGNHGLYLALVGILLFLNPYSLKAASSAGTGAFGVLATFVLLMALKDLFSTVTIRHFVSMGLAIALFFLCDIRFFLFFFPLMAILSYWNRMEHFNHDRFSYWFIIYIPTIVFVLAYAFATRFVGEQWPGFFDYYFEVLRADIQTWQGFFSHFLGMTTNLFKSIFWAIFCFPIIVFTYVECTQVMNKRFIVCGFFLLVSADFLAQFFTPDIFIIEELYLSFSIVCLFILLKRPDHMRRVSALVLLIFSIFSSSFHILDSKLIDNQLFVRALQGETLTYSAQKDFALGQWLRDKKDVLMDYRVAHNVIAARGNAKGLVLPHTTMFNWFMQTKVPLQRFIVVPSPKHPHVEKDRVSQTLSDLYDKGYPGYNLVYSGLGWRVYENEYAAKRDEAVFKSLEEFQQERRVNSKPPRVYNNQS